MRRGVLDLQILWNRLISICEEQAQTMIRAAFSPPVREAGDLSAGLFDLEGRMLAQAVTGTPGHINTMATAVQHFLKVFPIGTMKPGDSFITNDPWLASGHLNDATVVTPAFLKGHIVGIFAATVHLTDLGGRGMGPDAQDLFEEGVLIPHMYLVRQGVINEDLFTLLRANSREPLQVIGDLHAIIAAGDAGARSLAGALVEFGTEELDAIGTYILDTSRQATIKAISKLTPGIYTNKMTIDGYEKPVDLVAKMTIESAQVIIDFEGSSTASDFGINVVLAYTAAYSVYGIKCVVAPEVPSNHGSLAPFLVKAPEGSILNPLRPAPVSARHMIGHALPDAVMGCLEKALPGQTVAASGMMWNPYIRGTKDFNGQSRLWELFSFQSGGMGARSTKDGLSATAFPAALRNIPVEAIETMVPIIFWRKELRSDSGGAGRFRGGLGQTVEVGGIRGAPLQFQAMFERVENAAEGRVGGKPGLPGKVHLGSGAALKAKGQQEIPANDTLLMELPGGGGYGAPNERHAASIERDIEEGLVSSEAALRDYGYQPAVGGAV